MPDFFQQTREMVSALDAARYHRMEFDRRGERALCIFHPDHHPSMTFKDGYFHCWACGAHGSSIDLVAQLFGLSALDAVKKINTDFHLGLDLECRSLTPQEQERIQRRQQTTDTYKLYEQWRSDTIRILNQCFREAHFALKSLETPADLDQLTNAHAFAIREQAHVEWLADTLTSGTMAEQMQIFRERGKIGQLCNRILSNTPMKSGVA